MKTSVKSLYIAATLFGLLIIFILVVFSKSCNSKRIKENKNNINRINGRRYN